MWVVPNTHWGSRFQKELPVRPRSLDQLKESDLTTRDILWRNVKGLSAVQFLARLGGSIINLGGSEKKVVDEHAGPCTVLHSLPSEECRRGQLEICRTKNWRIGCSKTKQVDLVTLEEKSSPSCHSTDRHELGLFLGPASETNVHTLLRDSKKHLSVLLHFGSESLLDIYILGILYNQKTDSQCLDL